MAMMPALMPKTIESVWAPLYAKLAAEYLDRLPRGRWSISFRLSRDRLPRGFWPIHRLPDASDEDMQRWSQRLIDGAGNFGWTPGPFEASDIANAEMDSVSTPTSNACGPSRIVGAVLHGEREEPDPRKPDHRQRQDRDRRRHQRAARRLPTILYGLLTIRTARCRARRRQMARRLREGVRWVAPI